MNGQDRAGLGWTVVLRRQPVRIVEGRAEGGYTDAYELVCAECGDDPDLDYRAVSPGLQQIRGPYPFVAGIAAYQEHVQRCHTMACDHRPGRASRSQRGSPALMAGSR
jgi:hypothetical protein